MKKQLALLGVLLFLGIQVKAQTTHIVDNNANGIGDFTTLSAAITAATAGDIILLVPSATSYGSLTLTAANGKKLTIAGGGANGATGLYTKLDAISLSGGSAANTVLDGFVLGGFECESIEINFVDSVKVKAIKTTAVISSTNYQFRLRNSVGAEVEFIETKNMFFQGNTGLKIFHVIMNDNVGVPAIEIQTTTNFIVSNSFLLINNFALNTNSISFDANSTGLFNNNIVYLQTGYNRPFSFGGAVSITNNLFYKVHMPGYLANTITGGQLYQKNTFYAQGGIGYYTDNTAEGLLTLSATEQDANGNAYADPKFGFTNSSSYTLVLEDGSPAIDSGSGNDIDGTVADRGVFGGLDPMPKPMPHIAVGVSVVPSVTSLKLSLPTAVSGGKVILNVSGQSKKN